MRDHCEKYSQEELKQIFESIADAGKHTRLRKSRPEWGYYCVVYENKYTPSIPIRSKFPITYEELATLPVPLADHLVAVFNAAVRARLGVVDTNYPRDLKSPAPFAARHRD